MKMKMLIGSVEINLNRMGEKLEDGEIFVDKGEGGRWRWFIYIDGKYAGHSAGGFGTEDEAWEKAQQLMRDYKFRRGSMRP